MWNASQSAGGFMNDTQSPGAKGGSGDKGKKKQNVVPVLVREVLEAPEEGFTVEGMEVAAIFATTLTPLINDDQTDFAFLILDFGLVLRTLIFSLTTVTLCHFLDYFAVV
jgi:hypothetical protein